MISDIIKPEIKLRVFNFCFNSHSVVLEFKFINHKSQTFSEYAACCHVRTLKVHTCFCSAAYCIPSYCFHVSSFFSEWLLYLVLLLQIILPLLPNFSPQEVLNIVNCIIFDCLIYVPERDSRKWQLKLIQDLIHMFEAGSFCPFGITHLLPICPATPYTVHRLVPVL